MKKNHIPKEWEEVCIGQLGIVSTSSVDKKSRPNEKKVRLINYMDVYKNLHKEINSSINFMRVTAKESQIKSSDVKKGDVLFTPTSETPEDIGISAVVTEDLPNTLFSYHLLRLRFQRKVNLKFKKYMFNNPIVLKQFTKIAQGATRYVLTREVFLKVQLLLPPLVEQEKIAEILTAVDKNIEKTDEIIVECERIKKGLMQTLLTKGIPGGHTKFKKTVIGEVPEDWKVEFLVNVSNILLCNVDKKSNSDEKSVKLCNYIDVYKNKYITHKINFMKATASDNEISKFKIQMGDVLITKDSETPDDIAVSSVVIEPIDNLVCGYHLALIRPNSDKLDSLFLMNLFSNELIKNTIARKANGSTRFSLGMKTIQEIPILVPSLDEQKKIAQILTDLDERIQSEKTKRQQLIKLKLSLMQKLLSGEIRVKV